MLRKLLVPAAAVAAGVLMTSSSAFAFDCFVTSRSDQGATAVGHSKKWISIPVAGIMADDPANGGFGFCPAQVDAGLAALKAAGLPTVLATRNDKILLEGTGADRNGKTADGKGIDHFEESPLIGEIIGVATAAAADVTC
jgi:hypothetical protein